MDDVKAEAVIVESTVKADTEQVGMETGCGNVHSLKAEDSEHTITSSGDANVDLPASDLEQKIIKQVEYYFGDINLGRDKFLKEQMKLDDGWVTLEVLLTFNRLKQLSSEATVIATALRKSKSGLLQVSEDGKKIRRTPAKSLPDWNKERQDELLSRSIYAKGFPQTATLDQMMEFFEKFGQTEQVQMRKGLKKTFKGSCFVVYTSAQSAAKFLAEPDLKYDGVDLIRNSKDDYLKRKTEERQQRKTDQSKVKDELRKAREDLETKKLLEKMVKGAILCVEGLPVTIRRDDIKNFFVELNKGKVDWIDYNDKDTKCRVRFGEENGAQTHLTAAQEVGGGVVKIGGNEVTCCILAGEDEVEHWRGIVKARRDKAFEMKDRKQQMNRGRHRGGRGRGSGGRRPGKREADDSSDSANKKVKHEESDEDDSDENGAMASDSGDAADSADDS